MHVKTPKFKNLIWRAWFLKNHFEDMGMYLVPTLKKFFEQQKNQTIKTSYVFLGCLSWFCNLQHSFTCWYLLLPRRHTWKKKQWINVSFWSDYIIWLLNASLFKILELFWILATGNSVYIILFEFENLWHKCKFYRWWINHHQLLGMVCPFCTKS